MHGQNHIKLVSYPAAFIGGLLQLERQFSFGGIAMLPALIQQTQPNLRRQGRRSEFLSHLCGLRKEMYTVISSNTKWVH